MVAQASHALLQKLSSWFRNPALRLITLVFRTIEYMSPEVMNCSEASPASDVWGIGVITYQLLSGGISPFFAGNRFRTMSKVLECDFSLDQVSCLRHVTGSFTC